MPPPEAERGRSQDPGRAVSGDGGRKRYRLGVPFSGLGHHNLFSDPTLSEIGEAHGKSVAQVVLRWLIQRRVVVVQKSVRPERMRENIDVFDFELGDDEMARIAAMDRNETLFFDHRDPAMVDWLNGRRLG